MIKLYSAESIAFDFKEFHSVRLTFYCSRRKKPVAPHYELIKDFCDLEKGLRRRAEKYIDGFFTEGELSELRGYLHEVAGVEIEVDELELPFEVPPDLGTYDDLAGADGTGKIRLKVKKGYSLSMPVSALYDLEAAVPIIPHMDMKQRKYGMMFANLLLQKLNVPTRLNYGRIIEEIYDEAKLFVDKDSTEEKESLAQATILGT